MDIRAEEQFGLIIARDPEHVVARHGRNDHPGDPLAVAVGDIDRTLEIPGQEGHGVGVAGKFGKVEGEQAGIGSQVHVAPQAAAPSCPAAEEAVDPVLRHRAVERRHRRPSSSRQYSTRPRSSPRRGRRCCLKKSASGAGCSRRRTSSICPEVDLVRDLPFAEGKRHVRPQIDRFSRGDLGTGRSRSRTACNWRRPRTPPGGSIPPHWKDDGVDNGAHLPKARPQFDLARSRRAHASSRA